MITMILTLTVFALIVLYVFNRLTCGKTRSSVCLVGKVAIVTGGNSGLGYEVCKDLACRGCKVIIADVTDSTESRKKIIELTKNPNVISKKLDLASFKSIRNFAHEINETEVRLDILVNNAGIGSSSSVKTEDGFNPIIQVNYLGPFLLTHLLIDLLKKSSPSRIVFTSSCLAFLGNISGNSLSSTGECNNAETAVKFYSDSKLATIMASDLFAEKLKSYGIISNSLHPGAISTNIMKSFNWSLYSGLLSFIGNVLGKTVWEGAQTTIHLAVSEEISNVTGKYFWDCRPFIKPLQAQDTKLRTRIWDISEKCVNLMPDEKI